MASITEVNIGEKTNMLYYDPKENNRVSLIPKQLYPVHAKKVIIKRDITVRGKYRANIYNVVYEIAKECSKTVFTTETGEIQGSAFVGKELYSTGVFLFQNPGDGDNFEANNGSNDKYLRFCECLKVECPEIEVDVDGEKRMVKQFPELTESDIIGKPLLGYVDTQEYVKDGETKTYYKVKDFSEWKDGKFKDFELAELPF